MTYNIQVIAGADADASAISATGQIKDLISNEERETLGVTDKALLAAIEKIHGKAPDEVQVRDHELFAHYGWPQVHRVMEVQSAEIISVDMKQVALTTHEYENKRGTKPTTHTATLNNSVAQSVSTNWTASAKLTIGQKFFYKVSVPGVEVGGETSFGFEAAYGQGASDTQTSTITTIDAVTLVVDPGTTAKAVLTARKGTLKAQVTFRVFLEGQVFCNYYEPYEGHHHYALDVEHLMASAGISKEVICTQEIEVGFYADAKVVVTDDEKPDPMQVVPAVMTQK